MVSERDVRQQMQEEDRQEEQKLRDEWEANGKKGSPRGRGKRLNATAFVTLGLELEEAQ